MEIDSEVGTGLKASILFFVLILVGTLVYFVIQQNEELGFIYANQDIEAATNYQGVAPKTVDTPNPAP